jgi:acyl dehydratase
VTTHLEKPADLLELIGQPLGTSNWINITQRRVDLFAESTGDHQWIHTDTQRTADGPFDGAVAHNYLVLALAPMVISEVLQIRELTMAFSFGINTARFPQPVPVGSLIRASVSLISAEQKTLGVETVFGLTYRIAGIDRPACLADVVVLYP